MGFETAEYLKVAIDASNAAEVLRRNVEAEYDAKREMLNDLVSAIDIEAEAVIKCRLFG